MSTDPDLAAHARRLGIHTEYVDVHRRRHTADPEVIEIAVAALSDDLAAGAGAVLAEPVTIVRDGAPPDTGTSIGVARDVVADAELELADGTRLRPRVRVDGRTLAVDDDLPLGCHTLRVETASGDGVATVVRPPATMLTRGPWHGGSGLFVPAYALWDHDTPLPSFGLLGRLAGVLGGLGTDVLTTLPLYATFLDEPFDPSPYSPASRLHWSEVFVDDDVLPPAPVPPQGRYLDWAAVARRRREQLVTAAGELSDETRRDLDAFVHARPDVAAFARFLTERPDAPDGVGAGSSLRADAETVRRSHELAQLLADRQLAALAEASQHDGAAGLAIDLPIGCHPAGYERWARPDLFADGFAIGAPPDLFFTEGQNWGLPPQLPGAGRRSGHRLWRDLLARAGQHAALLRIDHVMAVHRLWWVPEGFAADRGVYVSYPQDELLAVIAATAAECGTVVVGEDLGTVPDEIGELLERWEMLGMHEEQFHMTPSMLPSRGLADIDARTVAGMRTHDMQPFAAFVAEQGDALAEYRRRLVPVLGREVGGSYGELLDAVIERLARSASALVTIDLDDLTGEPEPHNEPGKVLESNWCRRLERPLSDLLGDADVRHRLRLLAGR